MGRLFLRFPKSKKSPEHWRLISSQLDGPYADGRLALGTSDGWAKHCDRQAPNAELFQFRDRNDKSWLPACYMSVSSDFWTYAYTAAYVGADFLEPVGYLAERETVYSGTPGPGVYDSSSGSRGLQAWTYNSYDSLTERRATLEQLGYYALPLGMMIEEAELARTIMAVNDPDSWAAHAQLYRVDVDCTMIGYSVRVKQTRFAGDYYNPANTVSRLLGVGALRYLGAVRPEQPPPNQVIFFPEYAQMPVAWKHQVQNVYYPANIPFERTDAGTLIWAGGLNTLGVDGLNHGVEQVNPPVVATHIINILDYHPSDTLLYHAQTGLLGVPPTQNVPGSSYVTDENYLGVKFNVKIIYAF